MAFRSSSSLAGGNGTSAAVPVPTGAAVGDIAVIGLYMESTAALTTVPSGFTVKVDLQASATTRGRLAVYWKRLTAADTGTYTFAWSGSTWRAAACGLWSGRGGSGDPFDGTVGSAQSATAVTTLTVSTSPAAASGDALGMWTNFTGGNAYAPPTNYTERQDLDVVTLDTRDAVASGSTGSISATSNVSGFQKAFLGVLAASGGTSHTQTPSDNEGLTDAVQVETPGSLRPSDNEGLSDVQVMDRFQVRADNLGLTDTVTVAGPARFITGIAGSGNQQYPVDQGGQPILVKGDVIWAFPTNAGRWNGADWQGDITDYLDARAAQGFNLLMIGALGSTQNGGTADTGATHDGVLPFSGGNGVLNNTYWTRVDYILTEAAARGITVLMNVAYSYDMDDGALQSFSNANYTTYGTNLGNRYETAPNLIWGVGGDYFDTQATQLGNLFTAIEATGDTHLKSVQNYPESTSRKDISNNGTNSTGTTWSDWNFVYSYNVTYDGVEYAYDETSPVCVIWGDGHFDQDSTPDRKVMRDLVWWALSSGARGHIYGSEGTWAWASGALANVTSETVPATDLANYWDTFTSFPNWHQLVPDTDSSFVTAGRGTHAAALSSGGGGGEYNSSDAQDQYVTASVTPDGTLAVVYFPVDQTITVDDTELNAGYTATWVDPTNGSTSTATIGSTYSPTGSNALGGPDWLLVFEAPSGTGHTQTPADSEGLTDAAVYSYSKGPIESLGVTDLSSLQLDKLSVDAEGLTDSAALTASKAPVESLGVTDSVQVSLASAGTVDQTDLQAVTDTATLDQGRLRTDNLGLTDQPNLEAAKGTTDNLGLSDTASLTAAVARQPEDTLGLSDAAQVSQTSSGAINTSDNLGVTDTQTFTRGHAYSDAADATDLVAFAAGSAKTDTASLTDAVTVLLLEVRDIIDNAALTDSVEILETAAAAVTPRPYTGTTSRPGSGTTPRPFTGVTDRP